LILQDTGTTSACTSGGLLAQVSRKKRYMPGSAVPTNVHAAGYMRPTTTHAQQGNCLLQQKAGIALKSATKSSLITQLDCCPWSKATCCGDNCNCKPSEHTIALTIT
jgi:hypothetical protein